MATADKYKIQHGIAPPTERPQSPYPTAEMKVGDSFLIPTGKASAAIGLCAYHSKKGKKFVWRFVKGGARVWRVK